VIFAVLIGAFAFMFQEQCGFLVAGGAVEKKGAVARDKWHGDDEASWISTGV
jgi:hypothetical protein